MFDVVAGGRRRSVWTPRAVALSVVAHLLLLLGVFVAAAESPPPEKPGRDSTVVFPVPVAVAKASPRSPRPVTPPPPTPDEPRMATSDATPVSGDVPHAIPSEIPQYSQSEPRGNGFVGETSGSPSPAVRPAAGNADAGLTTATAGRALPTW
jgi:hypothetical protein